MNEDKLQLPNKISLNTQKHLFNNNISPIERSPVSSNKEAKGKVLRIS